MNENFTISQKTPRCPPHQDSLFLPQITRYYLEFSMNYFLAFLYSVYHHCVYSSPSILFILPLFEVCINEIYFTYFFWLTFILFWDWWLWSFFYYYSLLFPIDALIYSSNLLSIFINSSFFYFHNDINPFIYVFLCPCVIIAFRGSKYLTLLGNDKLFFKMNISIYT